ncbi:MAG: ATP-binding protein [Deltaproteobacteria bacterium]
MKIRIQTKLFLAMLAVACGVLAGMYLVLRWSFSRGFLDYVNRADRERIEQLSGVIEEAYAEEGSWRFVTEDPRRWQRLIRFSRPGRFRDSRSPRGPMHPVDEPPPPPPARPEPGHGFAHRVVLLDADKKPLVAPPGMRETPPLKDLRVGDKTVGYLGVLPLRALRDDLQLRFVREQRQAFALIALAMVFLAALLSIPLARRMVRRIRTIETATHRLASGRYDTRVPVGSSDELGRLARDFNALAQTLEQQEQSRRQWIADISHELRTPLSILRGEIEALQDGIRPLSPEAIGSLHAEVLRISRLVGDLYDLSLSDLGAMEYRKSDIDLLEPLREAIELFRPDFGSKGISLEADLPAGAACPSFADPERLHQLFSNLLENSLKYTDPGGSLRVFVERGSTTSTVHFQDSGPGVPEADLEKLFDRLYRVEGSRSRETGGAGLGLSICKSIVLAHGGTIGARPSPLGGLWVTIGFPRGE